MGLINDARFAAFEEKQALIEAEIDRCNRTYIAPGEAINTLLLDNELPPLTTGASISDLLRRPQLSYDLLAKIDENRPELPRNVQKSVEIAIKYDGYIKRQLAEVARKSKLEDKKLPEDIDYNAISGLRLEARQKLTSVRPLTVGQASRISGVSPADISVLLIWLGK